MHVLDDIKQKRNMNLHDVYSCGLMALQYVYRVLIDIMVPLITSSSTGNGLRHTFTHKEACNYHNLGFSVYLPIDSRIRNAGVVT